METILPLPGPERSSPPGRPSRSPRVELYVAITFHPRIVGSPPMAEALSLTWRRATLVAGQLRATITGLESPQVAVGRVTAQSTIRSLPIAPGARAQALLLSPAKRSRSFKSPKRPGARPRLSGAAPVTGRE